MACVCSRPGAAAWAAQLGDCVYTAREAASCALGLASLACWVVCTLPQLAANHARGSCAALSPAFLFAWLVGDATNLFACALGPALRTQWLSSVYFVSMDVVSLAQYVWMGSDAAALPGAGESAGARSEYDDLTAALLPPPHRRPPHPRARVRRALVLGLCCAFAVGLLVASLSSPHAFNPSSSSSSSDAAPDATRRFGRVGSKGGGPSEVPFCDAPRPLRGRDALTAHGLAWLSAASYVGSRLFQLRHSSGECGADGLSPLMFTTAVAANALYGASVALRTHSAAEAERAAPWLLGSWGVLCLDCVLAGRAHRAAAARRASTLGSVSVESGERRGEGGDGNGGLGDGCGDACADVAGL